MNSDLNNVAACDETQEMDTIESVRERTKKVSLKNIAILTPIFLICMVIGLIIGQVMLK